MERLIYSMSSAALLVALAAACASPLPDGVDTNARVASLHQPTETTVVIRIAADGSYYLNGERTPEVALTATLKELISPHRSKPYTMRIVAEKGVTGYYAVMAQNAGRDAGFSRMEGYAEVPADPRARIGSVKRWTQDFTGPGAVVPNTVPDTAWAFTSGVDDALP